MELEDFKESMGIRNERKLTKRSMILSAVEDRNSVQDQLTTASVELQIAEQC